MNKFADPRFWEMYRAQQVRESNEYKLRKEAQDDYSSMYIAIVEALRAARSACPGLARWSWSPEAEASQVLERILSSPATPGYNNP